MPARLAHDTTDLNSRIIVLEAASGSKFPTRATATETAIALAANAQIATVCANLPAPGVRVFRLVTNRAARARLYATVAHRDADTARAIGVDPTGNHGVLLDVVTTEAMLNLTLSPAVDVHSDNPIPITITNLGATGDTSVTFHYLKTET